MQLMQATHRLIMMMARTASTDKPSIFAHISWRTRRTQPSRLAACVWIPRDNFARKTHMLSFCRAVCHAAASYPCCSQARPALVCFTVSSQQTQKAHWMYS